MEEISSFINNNPTVFKLIISALLFIIILIVIRITNSLLFKTIKNNTLYYNAKKRFYFFYIALFIIALIIQWSETRIDVTLYIGFISAGVAFALREVFVSMVAWLVILTQKPFEVGDRINVNGQTGDIIDLKLFHFVIMEISDKDLGEQSTGKVAHVPNNYIFLYKVSNANKGFKYIWNEINVRITLESDFDKAKEMLLSIANKHALHIVGEVKEELIEASKKYMLQYNNLTPIVYTHVKEGHIHLTMRYLCEVRQARITENEIWSDILHITKEHDEVVLV
jgi:small-conductance mechanosensitive channel